MQFARIERPGPEVESGHTLVSSGFINTEVDRSMLLKAMQLAESQGVFLASSGEKVLMIVPNGANFDIQLIESDSVKRYEVDGRANLLSVMNVPVADLNPIHAPMVEALNDLLVGLKPTEMQPQAVQLGQPSLIGENDPLLEAPSKNQIIKDFALIIGGKSGFEENLPYVVKALESLNPAVLDSSFFKEAQQELRRMIDKVQVDPGQLQRDVWNQLKTLIDDPEELNPAATIALTERYRELTGDSNLEVLVSSATDNAYQVSDGTTIFSSGLLSFICENYPDGTAQQIIDDILMHEYRHYTLGHGAQLGRLSEAAISLVEDSVNLHHDGKISYGEMNQYQVAVLLSVFAELRALESQADGDGLSAVTVEALEKYTGGHGSPGYFDTHPPHRDRVGE